jgi:hypothetical protein
MPAAKIRVPRIADDRDTTGRRERIGRGKTARHVRRRDVETAPRTSVDPDGPREPHAVRGVRNDPTRRLTFTDERRRARRVEISGFEDEFRPKVVDSGRRAAPVVAHENRLFDASAERGVVPTRKFAET